MESEFPSPSLDLDPARAIGDRGIWNQSYLLLGPQVTSPRPVHLPPVALDSERAQQFGPRLFIQYIHS